MQTHIVGNDDFVMHGHRAVNVFGYSEKDGFEYAHTANAAVVYDELKMGQVYILMINQAIEMKGLYLYLLFSM